MFSYKKDSMKVPIKCWMNKEVYDLDIKTQEQIEKAASLPFAFDHIVLCPDGHPGIGIPIGTVFAAKDVIIPSFVGVDIGCGMNFFATNIPVASLLGVKTGSGELLHAIISNFKRNVPTGFARHREPQTCSPFLKQHVNTTVLETSIGENALLQLGTLGGGNHFIELQVNDAGMLCFMLHSGSRNMGNKLAQYHTKVAQTLNAKYFAACPPQMAFLPTDSVEGFRYINDMSVAVEFAKANRHLMVERCKSVLLNMVEKYCGITGVVITNEIESTHNYAALEHHFGEDVWVHRKGAIKIKDASGPLQAIIPGSCGTASYIVVGNMGNTTDSFHSASHGAGRTRGRKDAKANITAEQATKSLEGIVHVNNIRRIIDECPLAYKNIDEVIKNEVELVTPLMRLKPIAFLKGEGEDE